MAKIRELSRTLDGDEKTGVKILLKALEELIRQFTTNAGVDDSVIIKEITDKNSPTFGYDVYSEKYIDMLEADILDPVRALRMALENASSIASIVLTAESLVANIPEELTTMPLMNLGRSGMY